MLTVKSVKSNAIYSIDPEKVIDWAEIALLVEVSRERKKTINRKIANDIINHRETLEEFMKLSDDELKNIIIKNSSNLDYSNRGMTRATMPFNKTRL